LSELNLGGELQRPKHEDQRSIESRRLGIQSHEFRSADFGSARLCDKPRTLDARSPLPKEFKVSSFNELEMNSMTSYRNIVIGALLLVALGLSAFTLLQLIKPSPVKATPNQSQGKGKLDVQPAGVDVIDKAAESKDPRERAKRSAKNNRYDKNDSRARRLTELPSGGGAVHGNEQPPPFPVPVKQSDAIIVGSVTKAQPYLTNSETGMYTELNVLIEQVLKNDGIPSAVVGSTLTVDRESGAMRLADGRVIRYETGGIGSLPRNGHRYMLFVKRVHDGADISIVTGYEVRGGKVFPLDGETRIFDPATGQITRKAPFEGVEESSFLTIVLNAIANPSRVLMPEWRLQK